MKLKKIATIAMAGIMTASFLTGCGSNTESKADGADKITVAMVSDVAGINDQSYNQSAWEGLERAKKELGIEIKYLESKQDSDYATNVETLADEEVDLIIGVGSKLSDTIKEAAKNYPDQKFAIIDETYDEIPSNVKSVLFESEQASYLVGLIAGKMSETKNVGFIGGLDIPVINTFKYGYMAGVKAADANCEIQAQYANSFNDQAKGKAITNQMISKGADVVFTAAGDVGTGSMEAIKEANKYGIGVDRDQSDLAPQNILTSAIKRVDTHIEEIELEQDEELAKAKHTFDNLYEKYKEEAKKEQEAVRAAGGLAIIGTERHESRRIDNQLRGRSGRQGDPGSSRFYIGLDDELMRLFGSERIQGVVEKIGLEEDMPVEHRMLTKSIENAQKKVEGRNFGIRKHVLQYDDVMNKQRQVIYDERGRVLEGEDINEQIQSMIKDIISDAVAAYVGDNGVELENLKSYLYGLFMPKESLEGEELKELKSQELSNKIYETAHDIYREKEEIIGSDRMREVERIILLQCVDNHWIDHIDAMDQLRQGIGLRALGQQDPVIAYKMEGFDMFDDMIKHIQEDTVRYLFNITIEQQPKERKSVVDVDTLASPSDLADNSPVVKERTVGRNEPCPCGSGKKFKHCCGK